MYPVELTQLFIMFHFFGHSHDGLILPASKTNPNRQVGLVSFNNEVTIIGDGCSAPVTLAGDTLQNADALRAAAVEFAGVSHPIQATHQVCCVSPWHQPVLHLVDPYKPSFVPNRF